MQVQDLPVPTLSADAIAAQQSNGELQSDDSSDVMPSPTPETQQVSLQEVWIAL